jgi:serine/threonine-protein kinase
VEPKPPPTVTPKPARASELTANGVNRVMVKHSDKVRGCLKDYINELPAKREVLLQITIANSGKVIDTQIPEPGTVPPGLVKCMRGVMGRVKFPANSNKPEFSIQIPLQFPK